MIKICYGNNITLGLDQENISLLLDNKPISFPGSHVNLPKFQFIILANKTLEDVIGDLRSIGVPVPEEVKNDTT